MMSGAPCLRNHVAAVCSLFLCTHSYNFTEFARRDPPSIYLRYSNSGELDDFFLRDRADEATVGSNEDAPQLFVPGPQAKFRLIVQLRARVGTTRNLYDG